MIRNQPEVNQLQANQLEIIRNLISQGVIYYPYPQVEEQHRPVYPIQGLDLQFEAIQLDSIRALNSLFARSDGYAEFVRNEGQRGVHRIDDSFIRNYMGDIRHAIDTSAGEIVDEYTAICIEETIHEALTESPTFRQAVAFSIGEQRALLNFRQNVVLSEVRYRNFYSRNSNSPINLGNIDLSGPFLYDSILSHIDPSSRPITPYDLRTVLSDTNAPPLIYNNYFSYEEGNIHHPYISISVAPNEESYLYPIWQFCLIHEIIHAITNGMDPLSHETRLGPVEILAQFIITEMDATIRHPNARVIFNSYNDPERIRALMEFEWASLLHCLFRSHDLPQRVNRILEISDRTTAEQAGQPYTPQPQAELLSVCPFDNENNSRSSLIPGVDSAQIGKSFFCINHPDIIFDDGLRLSNSHLIKYDLGAATMALNLVRNGRGFYQKEDLSWKDWYHGKVWSGIFRDGIYEYGKRLTDFDNEFGYIFKDNSFLVGFRGIRLKALKYHFGHEDKWIKVNKHFITSNSFGQIFFDKDGRPAAIVFTSSLKGLYGNGYSFIYNKGKWEYESEDDWDLRRFFGNAKSLDPRAPRFLINNITKHLDDSSIKPRTRISEQASGGL